MAKPLRSDSRMFRVVIRQGDKEHVYMTANTDARSARSAVLRDMRLLPSDPDVSHSVTEMTSENLPTRLYTIDLKTGDMS